MDVLWTGGEGGMETRLVERENIPFKTIPAAGVHGVGLRALPGNLVKLLRGTTAARHILRSFKPDVLLFTGGYVAVPMALAGRKVPSALYVPDIEPGLALKTLAFFADRIAVTAPESLRYFRRKERVSVSGYPTRNSLTGMSQAEARRRLQLDSDEPVLLVLGGSKGARSLNKAVLAHLPKLLDRVQMIHISGELDWPEVDARSRAINHPHYHPHPYLHEEMGAALAAADLALSRAGASTLGEYPLFGLPSILVPYPYAWRYQKVNADHLVKSGAAVMIEDANLTTQLLPVLDGLLKDPSRLNGMRAAARVLSNPDAAARIGALLVDLAGGRH